MTIITSNHNAGQLDAAIGSGDTTLSSPGFEFIPVVSAPDLYRIVLDPDGSAGKAEVCYVTAHTASATTVTVTRGEEQAKDSSVARAHALNTEWIHANTAVDLDDFLRQSKATAKGSLYVASASGVVDELTVGANGTIPVADSAAGLGVAYKGGLVELAKVTDPGTSPFVLMTGIPGDYQDLLITVSARIVGPSTTHQPYGLRFNSDTGTNYSRFGDEVDGAGTRSVPAATGQTNARVGYASDVGQQINRIWIPNYTGSGTKSIDSQGVSMFGGAVGADTLKFSFSSRWQNGAAITRIDVTYATADGDFAANTTFTLYGVGAA